MTGPFYISFILGFFVSCVTANRAYPPEKVIKLALAVSKATYLPLKGNRFIKDGGIVENRHTVVPNIFPGIKSLLLIYNPKEDRIACSIRGWTAKPYENKETEVIMFKNDQQKLVVFGFRGTEAFNLIDWGKDFTVVPKKLTIDGQSFITHKGFSDRYNFIARWFESEYQNVPHDYTIVITGHSLGGAEAYLAAVYAAGKLGRRPDAVITFGAPMVGAKSFKDYYNQVVGCSRTRIITENNDLVTVLPPLYLHFCKKTRINGQKGWLRVGPIASHDLYGGYDRGIKRRYGNVENTINFGCDQPLN